MSKISKFRKPSQRRKRSLSRLIAIQIFYQNDFLNGEKKLAEIKEDVIENYTLDDEKNISSYREKIDENFLDNLLFGMENDVKNIDEEISKFLKDGWNLERLDEVAKQILRLGTFELKFSSDVPPKVIIDEYVDIAASFFDQKKITFVNGVLDNLARKLRIKEFAG